MLPGYTGSLMFSLVFVTYSVSFLHARLQGDALEAFEKSLLQLFGLKSRPNASKKAALPQHMIDLYRDKREAEENFGMFVRGKGTLPANTVRSFYHSHQAPGEENSPENAVEQFFFNVSAIPTDEELTSAELRLFRQGCTDCKHLSPTVRIEVHEIIRPSRKTASTISRLIDVRKVDATETVWETFDVSPAVLRWKDSPHLNHGIEVRTVVLRRANSREFSKNNTTDTSRDPETQTQKMGMFSVRVNSTNTDSVKSNSPNVSTKTRRRKSQSIFKNSLRRDSFIISSKRDTVNRRARSIDAVKNAGDRTLVETIRNHVRLRRSTGDHNWHSQKPLLVTFTDDGKRSRTKRATRSNRRRGRAWRRKVRKLQCRRHTLYVDFSHVGWNDWIIAPHGYHAYYCHGNCGMPLVDYLNTTNHAIVQNIMNEVDPKVVPRACCVPTELSPISMLYMDEYGEYVLKSYQNMVVEGCGCR